MTSLFKKWQSDLGRFIPFITQRFDFFFSDVRTWERRQRWTWRKWKNLFSQNFIQPGDRLWTSPLQFSPLVLIFHHLNLRFSWKASQWPFTIQLTKTGADCHKRICAMITVSRQANSEDCSMNSIVSVVLRLLHHEKEEEKRKKKKKKKGLQTKRRRGRNHSNQMRAKMRVQMIVNNLYFDSTIYTNTSPMTITSQTKSVISNTLQFLIKQSPPKDVLPRRDERIFARNHCGEGSERVRTANGGGFSSQFAISPLRHCGRALSSHSSVYSRTYQRTKWIAPNWWLRGVSLRKKTSGEFQKKKKGKMRWQEANPW